MGGQLVVRVADCPLGYVTAGEKESNAVGRLRKLAEFKVVDEYWIYSLDVESAASGLRTGAALCNVRTLGRGGKMASCEGQAVQSIENKDISPKHISPTPLQRGPGWAPLAYTGRLLRPRCPIARLTWHHVAQTLTLFYT